MNRGEYRPLLVLALLLCRDPRAEVPRVPFSGVYGATQGAGSITGWDRHGGDNPAVSGAPGFSVAAAGYSPFGLEGLRVLEASAARDRRRWGSSLAWRGLWVQGRHAASVSRAQLSLRIGERWKGGVSLAHHLSEDASGNASGAGGFGAGFGLLWRPSSLLSLGAAWEGEAPQPRPWQRAGFGADIGTRLGKGYAWRLCADFFFEGEGERMGVGTGVGEWRLGLGFQFHPLLAAYAGFSPRQESAALGVRFGMGGFEGFSALRRHGALGGTSIQGLRWRGARSPDPALWSDAKTN